jgi:hypothetical protein
VLRVVKKGGCAMPETPAGAVRTVRIGSDLVVDRVGYGARQLAGHEMWGEYPDREGGIALLRGRDPAQPSTCVQCEARRLSE